MCTVIFLKIPSLQLSMMTISIKYRNGTEIVTYYFYKIVVLLFKFYLKGPYFEGGMFIYSGHRTMVNKLLTTEYE
jgi:hypothetical protein